MGRLLEKTSRYGDLRVDQRVDELFEHLLRKEMLEQRSVLPVLGRRLAEIESAGGWSRHLDRCQNKQDAIVSTAQKIKSDMKSVSSSLSQMVEDLL